MALEELADSAILPSDEVTAWICLGHEEALDDALRRNAPLHSTRQDARVERHEWPAVNRPNVVPLMIRRHKREERKRRFLRQRGGVWARIRCAGCGYVGEMIDVHRCERCDAVLCSRKCCDGHECDRRLPQEEKRSLRTSPVTPSGPHPAMALHPSVSEREPHFVRYAEGAWTRIRCVACGYVGEMVDVFRCGLCDGLLCGQVCRDAHDCRAGAGGA